MVAPRPVKTKRIILLLVVILVPILLNRLVSSGGPTSNPRISLVFQKYSSLDGDVAFLWLTNASSRSYRLFMTGGNKSLLLDNTEWGNLKQSWMLNCEFHDETQTGWTNWMQMPSPVRGGNSYLQLGPTSGLMVRVPLPPDVHRRKVAVLYETVENVPAFWGTAVGIRVFRMLPQSLRNHLVSPKPVLERVWCNRDLAYPATQASGEINVE
jgi:hypothetical protein